MGTAQAILERGQCMEPSISDLHQFFLTCNSCGEVIQAVCTLHIALKRGDSMFSLLIGILYPSLTRTLEIMLDAHK